MLSRCKPAQKKEVTKKVAGWAAVQSYKVIPWDCTAMAATFAKPMSVNFTLPFSSSRRFSSGPANGYIIIYHSHLSHSSEATVLSLHRPIYIYV